MNDKIHIAFGIASKNEDFKIDSQAFDEFNQSQDKVFLVPTFWKNNTTSLPTLYNSALKTARSQKVADIQIFMHADVQLDLKHFIDHLIECKDKYDVIGLCGCKKFSVGQSPLNWFTGSNPFPDSRWGCVTHGELGDKTTFFSEDRQDIEDSEVACIDGLCIVLCKNALYSEILFDEQFKFDQYDTDFSAQCLMTYKFKLGVIVEKSLHHFSVGKSILTQDFLAHEKDLRKKWNWAVLPKDNLKQQ